MQKSCITLGPGIRANGNAVHLEAFANLFFSNIRLHPSLD